MTSGFVSNERIDDYAGSMFRYERLHERWLTDCAEYLRYVFGSFIEGKTFIDYAFGRGNWSLAALKAGAAKVISVDASIGNVRRFSDYCSANGISGVEVVHGNIMLEDLKLSGDVLWVYGILHHISDAQELINRLVRTLVHPDGLALLYAYDQGSLREMIVSAARKLVVYRSEDEFAADSLLYSPAARMRARDDLTAPVVDWYTAQEVVTIGKNAGLNFLQQLESFSDHQKDRPTGEFAPHHILSGRRGSHAPKIAEQSRPAASDFTILSELANLITGSTSKGQKRKIAVGLFNTHFGTLQATGSAEACIVEDYLYLFHGALRLNCLDRASTSALGPYVEATLASAAALKRSFPADILRQSVLARHLTQKVVRF